MWKGLDSCIFIIYAMEINLVSIIQAVAPSNEHIAQEVSELKYLNPQLSNDQLALRWGKRIRNNYTSVGVATALPSAIPGIGTAAQIAIEAGTISADLALMLRWMGKLCMGIGMIYGNNPSFTINQDLVNILGLWSGVVDVAKNATKRVGTKVAVVQFNKHVSGKVLAKINKRVGTTILTKYGGKRGGVALGKLVPFGVGAVIAGGFNYFTFNAFMKSAINYYKNDNDYVMFEE
ncbi:MAG: hypothetical protein IJK78_11510 [Bacteroidales bacterium]|nr:hypothetical protein [Bacteroidales bacterium]